MTNEHIIMRRECWGTEVDIYLLKYEHLSLRAEFWNCPKPSTLVCVAYLSWYLLRKILGFFCCGRDFGLLSSVAKKYQVSFLFYQVTFEVSYDYDTQTDMPLVSATTALTHALYNLFRKLLFSHFHTEPLFPRGIISKIVEFILGFSRRRREIH